jgi:hypothetical protein
MHPRKKGWRAAAAPLVLLSGPREVGASSGDRQESQMRVGGMQGLGSLTGLGSESGTAEGRPGMVSEAWEGGQVCDTPQIS